MRRWRLLALPLFFLLMPITSSAAEWDNIDRSLFGAFITLEVIDAAQTYKIHRHQDEYREANPLYGKDPNMGLVVGTKILSTSLIYWLVKDASSGDRKLALTVADALQFSVVAHNYAIGLKIGF